MDPNKSVLDIIIPVFNEAENIGPVLDTLKKHVKTPFQVQICYDLETDTTLPVLRKYDTENRFEIIYTKNPGRGPHKAITTGFESMTGEAALVFPADDILNAHIIDSMYQKFKEGCEIVAASRFMEGGSMKGCPLIKSILVRTASFTLYWFAFIPIKDSSNGFRLFSKKILNTVKLESTLGFTYSIELLVKGHRLGMKIGEVPASWLEREKGQSKFKVFKWLPHYMKWYAYGFKTTYLGLKSKSKKG